MDGCNVEPGSRLHQDQSGCAHCYALCLLNDSVASKATLTRKGSIFGLPEKLNEPLKWRSPKRVFVNSMSDLFHDAVPDDYIASVVDVMVRADWHTFQVLTKRSQRMRDLLKTRLRFASAKPHI